MSKHLYVILKNLVIILALISNLLPSLAVITPQEPVIAEAAPVDSPAPEPLMSPVRQGPNFCALSVGHLAYNTDGPYPDHYYPSSVYGLAPHGFFDVAYPEPNGRSRNVKVNDQLVVYLELINRSTGFGGNPPIPPCTSTPVTVTVQSIAVRKNGANLGSMFESVSWPNPGSPGVMQANDIAVGLFSFNVALTDTTFHVWVDVTYTCTGIPECGSGPFTNSQSYPSPDLRALPSDPNFPNQRYGDIYGGNGNVFIQVVGPRATINVLAPSSGYVAQPFEVVDYVIEVTSQAGGVDAIRRLTDSPDAPIPKCNEGVFSNPPPSDPTAGWYEDVGGTPVRVDSSDLTTSTNGVLGAGGKLTCRFQVQMNPSIINDPINNAFVLTGGLVAYNTIGVNSTFPVQAPPVVIANASVSISKTIISPTNPQDGIGFGEQVTYRITVSNTGQTPLDNFVIFDSLVGPISSSGATLQPGQSFNISYPYTVGLTDSSPLVNTVTIEAHPVTAPANFRVQASSATSIVIRGAEINVTLVLFAVDSTPYNPATNQPPPKAGSVLTYRVQYCNQSVDIFRDLRYVAGYPTLINGPRPTFVDSVLLDGTFGPGCYTPAGTTFTYTVPSITSPSFQDPVVNSIRVRATNPNGAFKYAEHTLVTNLVSDEVEITAYRYSIDDPGTPLGEDTAALRGETVYYHFEVDNKSATPLCNVEIRHYIRDTFGNIIPGNPFVIPNSQIVWNSGVNGRLEADGAAGQNAFGNVSFIITGDTPDPLYRIFEAYAPSNCLTTLPQPYIDRVAIITDISNIQLNNIITVFAEDQPGVPLEFGFRQPGLRYQFTISSTNVGVTFNILSLQYCVYRANGSCPLESFPIDGFDYFSAGNTTFFPFETRSDRSSVLISATGLNGDEPTPLRIQVILTGDEAGKTVKVRILHVFPLLTDDFQGGIVSGPEELVRGDGPALFNYGFINNTSALLVNVRVLNLLETGTAYEEGVYEDVGVPGFPANVYYEVCTVHGQVLDGSPINGTCRLTYHDGIPSGQFQMQVLVVGTLSGTGQKVIAIGLWAVEEIDHVRLEKIGPGIAAVNSIIDFTITIVNNSLYQPIDFQSPDGFIDVITPEVGTLIAPTLADFVGLTNLGGGVYRLPIGGTATAIATLQPPVDGFGDLETLTNRATFIGVTAPNPDGSGESVSGRQISETATATVTFTCPIMIAGFFIDNPDPFDDTVPPITVGESKRVLLAYLNIGSQDLVVSSVTDTIFEREMGRPLDFSDILWPDPSNPGVLRPNEFFTYEMPIIIRPIDFTVIGDTTNLTWINTLSLAVAPAGCEQFTVEWYFEISNPVQIVKSVLGSGLAFPGDSVLYRVTMAARSEHTDMFLQQLDDSLLTTSPLQMEFEQGSVGINGRLMGLYDPDNDEARMLENGTQNAYVVSPNDPITLTNIATITFYVPSDSGPPTMEKGPNYPMANYAQMIIGTANPLVLTLLPSTFDASPGSRIDIDVSVTNFSSNFTIENIVLTTGDAELATGLNAAGYVPPIGPLGPAQSRSFLVTDPQYTIPGDIATNSLTICAQATGDLAGIGVTLPQVETCVTINILPPDLVVEKEAFADPACAATLPDEDGNNIGEVSIGNNVYYRITLTNESLTQIFSEINITDVTNDGTDLSNQMQTAFLAANGGSNVMNPGTQVVICQPYLVTAAALANPVLTNTVTVNATSEDVGFTVTSQVSVDVVDNNISIGKRTDRNVAFPGTTIQYTLVIINRNQEGLTLVLADVWDSLITGRLPGPPDYHATCVGGGNQPPNFSSCDPTITSIRFDDPGWTWPTATPGVIPPSEQALFVYEYLVQPNDPDPLINVAGVEAYLYDSANIPWDLLVDGEGEPVQPYDETQALVAITNSQLLVRKIAIPSTTLAGGTVTYQISITNVGDRPVTGLQVVDCNPFIPCDENLAPFSPGFGGINLTSQIVPISAQSSLPPFGTAIVNSYQVVMPPTADILINPSLDPFVNTVYAIGNVTVDGAGTIVPTAPGSDTAVVDIINPGIRITKSPSVGAAAIGEIVDYTIQIFNTGTDPIRLDAVYDVVPGDSAWTPITTMKLNSCDESAPDFEIGPTSTDRLEVGEFVCAIVPIIVRQPQSGSNEFVNTVRVEATGNPDGSPQALVDGASAEIDIRSSELLVIKEAYCIPNGTTCITPQRITQVKEGETYEYRITITNTSIKAMRQINLYDPDYLNGQVQTITNFTGVGNNDALFDPGEVYVFSYPHTANLSVDTDGTTNAYTNTVNVVGVEDNNGQAGPLTPLRRAQYTVIIEPADLSVEKVVCVGDAGTAPDFSNCVQPITFAQPGDYLWYQVTITNPSAIQINTITVTDTLQGLLSNTSNSGVPVVWPAGEGSLPPCEEPLWTPPDNCPTAIYVYRSANAVSGADASITNTAIVNAMAGSSPITISDSATAIVSSGDLAVTIVEDNGRTEAVAGTQLNFTITVYNLGPSTISNIAVRLPFTDGANLLVPPFNILSGGQPVVITRSYVVTGADTVMQFEVLAEGTVAGGFAVSDTDIWTVTRVVPGMSVTKVADRSVARPGDTITYTISVQNTGTAPITTLSVTDSLLDITPAWPTSIAAGVTITRQYTYTVTGNEGNPLVNTVLVQGVVAGSLIVVSASAEVFITDSDLLVTNTPSTPSAVVGDTVSFTYGICNLSTGTSPTDDFTNVTLTDDDGTFTLPSTTLTPGQCFNAVRTITVTADDVPQITRTAVGTADSAGGPLAQAVTRTIIIVPLTAGDIRLDVIPSATTVMVGDTLGIDFVVTNVGSSQLTITNFVDLTPWYTGFTPTPIGRVLAPGTSALFTGNTGPLNITGTTPDPVSGTWIVTAQDTLGTFYSHSDSISVPIITADTDLVLNAVANMPFVPPGGTVTYTYTVWNISDTARTAQLQLVDDTCTAYTEGGQALWGAGVLLLPNQPATATATCMIDASYPDPTVDHEVEVYDTAQPGTPEDSVIVRTPVGSATALDLTVASDIAAVPPGGIVTYTYTVLNQSISAVTAQLALDGHTCTTYTPGAQALWGSGALIQPNTTATATATCAIAINYTNPTVDHTISVFEASQPDNPLDTETVQTPVDFPETALAVEIQESNPAVWRTNDSITLIYRLHNTSLTDTITGITRTVAVPTPCTNESFFNGNGVPTVFNGTLAPDGEIYVHCTYAVQASDYPQVTAVVNATGVSNGEDLVGQDTRTFDVVDLALVVTLTATQPNANNNGSVVDEGDTIGFTLRLQSTGRSQLVLPPQSQNPFASSIFSVANPALTVGNLGNLYSFFSTACNWPLDQGETCTVRYTDSVVTSGAMRYTALATHPTPLMSMVGITLQDDDFGVQIAQQGTWGIVIQRPSMSIQSITVSPNPGVNGQPVTITAVIMNNGATSLQSVTANLTLEDVLVNNPTGIFLTGTRQQSAIITIPMTLSSTTIAAGGQATATATWTVDRISTIRAIVNAGATTTGGSVPTVTARSELTFTTAAATQTDPDGNPLDPNALDPRITKTSSAEGTAPGERLTFTINVTNGSTTAMSNITLVDPVPEAFTVVSATTTSGVSVVTGQLVTVTLETLAPGARFTVTIVVQVADTASVPSLLVNEACANVENRDTICAEVEVSLGAFGSGDGTLPTTGYQTPATQGLSGVPGVLGIGLLLMLAGLSTNRKRWLIGGGAATILLVAIIGAVLLLSDDESKKKDDEPQAVATETVDPTARPTLARRPTLTPMPTATDAGPVAPPPTLPFAPTLRPSPTPYIAPTPSGPRLIDIPKLGFSRPIPIVGVPLTENSWDVSQLGHNVGWLDKTTWLEPSWGNTVLVGHVQLDDNNPGPFYFLGDLVVGDEIVILEGDQQHVFEIVDIDTVPPNDIQVTYPSVKPMLTLMTCTNWDRARGVFSDRLVIRAVPIVEEEPVTEVDITPEPTPTTAGPGA